MRGVPLSQRSLSTGDLLDKLRAIAGRREEFGTEGVRLCFQRHAKAS